MAQTGVRRTRATYTSVLRSPTLTSFTPPPLFCSEIPKQEFETLVASPPSSHAVSATGAVHTATWCAVSNVADSAHKDLLAEWYLEDTSRVPLVYVLQPRFVPPLRWY
eukprot:3224844-Rhodomonas_salina.3